MIDFNNKKLETYKSVGGWLLLLCFGLTIGSPLRTLYTLSTSYSESSQYFDQFPGLAAIFYIDCILSSILTFLSIRAGIALWDIKPGAVNIAKQYLFFYLGYAVIASFLPFVAGLPSAVNDAMIPEVAKSALQSIFFFGIWFSYLNVSKRVKATYRTYYVSNENENQTENKSIEINAELPFVDPISEVQKESAPVIEEPNSQLDPSDSKPEFNQEDSIIYNSPSDENAAIAEIPDLHESLESNALQLKIGESTYSFFENSDGTDTYDLTNSKDPEKSIEEMNNYFIPLGFKAFPIIKDVSVPASNKYEQPKMKLIIISAVVKRISSN